MPKPYTAPELGVELHSPGATQNSLNPESEGWYASLNYYTFIFLEIIFEFVEIIFGALFLEYLINANTNTCLTLAFARSDYNLSAIRVFSMFAFASSVAMLSLTILNVLRYIAKPGKNLRGYVEALERDYMKAACTGIRARKFFGAVSKDAVFVIVKLITNNLIGNASSVVTASLVISCISICKELAHEVTQAFCCVICPCCGGCKDHQHKGLCCRFSTTSIRLGVFIAASIICSFIVSRSTSRAAEAAYEIATITASVQCISAYSGSPQFYNFSFNFDAVKDSDRIVFDNITAIYMANGVFQKRVQPLIGARVVWYSSQYLSGDQEELFAIVDIRRDGTFFKIKYNNYDVGSGSPVYRYEEYANPAPIHNTDVHTFSQDIPLQIFYNMDPDYFSGDPNSNWGIECPPGSNFYSMVKPNNDWFKMEITVNTLEATKCASALH